MDRYARLVVGVAALALYVYVGGALSVKFSSPPPHGYPHAWGIAWDYDAVYSALMVGTGTVAYRKARDGHGGLGTAIALGGSLLAHWVGEIMLSPDPFSYEEGGYVAEALGMVAADLFLILVYFGWIGFVVPVAAPPVAGLIVRKVRGKDGAGKEAPPEPALPPLAPPPGP